MNQAKSVISKQVNVAETLYTFIRPDSPEDIPVQYGELSRPSDLNYGPTKPASEFTVKGGEKVNIQIEGIEIRFSGFDSWMCCVCVCGESVLIWFQIGSIWFRMDFGWVVTWTWWLAGWILEVAMDGSQLGLDLGVVMDGSRWWLDFGGSDGWLMAGATITWDRVVGGWDLAYSAEFVPNAEGNYTKSIIY
ncbi:hypothetical protein Ddye_018118 [Dipteronia dyeriana]|uniref:Patellin-1-6 C-terminal GOLD domain-containing protein n=1 Tax=Dipteronia dyeriana TaxID=168575 RepID=A0AAD9UAT0_9ROSI|nr:hypothetical protein Ddye_018118 [Dipteronia dyeriana]